MAIEYASKNVAGWALGTGIAGLANSVLGNNCNGGLLGNLFGNNCGCNARAGAELQFVSGLQSEIAQLKAQNYSDKTSLEAYKQSVADNKELRAEFFANINPLINETHNKAVADAEKIARLEEQIKCCCEKSVLQNQILDQKMDSQSNLLAGKINETALVLNGKIDTMQSNYNSTFNSLNQTIACIADKVNSVTKITLDSCKLCPGVVYAAQSVPATGTIWYPGCVSPVAPSTTTSTPAA